MENQLDEPIELRGHHIGMFGAHLWYNISRRNRFPNRNIDLVLNDNFMREYLDKTKNHEILKSIFLTIIEKPETKIKIVKGLDSICSTCIKKDFCLEEDGEWVDDEDSYCLKEYNLELGEIYPAKLILESIKIYPSLTNYLWKSPREKRWDLRLIMT
ncbi:Uncharacterised protein [uncultured archaeon]|nr:Uncharacterised protein [uncultured archaeon]